MECEVKRIFQKLESKDEIENIRKLGDRSNRAKTNVWDFQEEEILKCMTSKYFKIIMQEKFPGLRRTSLQIEKDLLKTQHKALEKGHSKVQH